jgi:hypothetical protein
VKFWTRGDSHAFTGYTTNVSMTGLFIATSRPLPAGERLRIEVVHPERGFVVEGVVAHARKYPAELARLQQSGMGVRFLSAAELVREILPPGLPEGAETQPVQAVAPDPPPAPPPQTPPPPGAPSARPAGGASFSVRFGSAREFLEVHDRDLRHGGLFVSARHPARLQEVVEVEIHPPEAGAGPVAVRARVVQRFEPSPGDGLEPERGEALAGMGLEILDAADLLERLRPVVERLRG